MRSNFIRRNSRAKGFPWRGKLWSVLRRKPLPPLIRPLCGHLPPGEGYFSAPAGFCIEFAAQALRPGGRGVPRCARISYAETAERCLPCVGGGGCPQGQSEGVYGSNFVGDYRTIASSKPIAFTPLSRNKCCDSSPYTPGAFFSVPVGSYADFYRSDIAAQRARHASPLQCHAGTFHRPYRALPGDLRFSSKNHHRPREKSRGRWL